jgi:hypothetical protein
MSPALVKKYLEAARRVSEYLVLTPGGLEFAPHPVVADTDRDKFCVNRIVNFYKRQHTDYAEYFMAAWRFENRAALGQANLTLGQIAAEAGLSARYLETVRSVLVGPPESSGPIAALQAMWRELPKGDATQQDAARVACERMRDFVVAVRAKLIPKVENLTAPRIQNGAQPLVLWKNRQMAANRMRYTGGARRLGQVGLPEGSAAAKVMAVPAEPEAAKGYEGSFSRFCSTFPDAFYISERARVYLDPEKEKKLTGRLLSAGFHSQMGYFRDDSPLCELMLDDGQRRELDRLWQELDFVASAPVRQYTGFIWFERTDSSFMRDREFDIYRAEDKDCTSEVKVRGLSELYLAKAERNGASEVAVGAIRDYFDSMSAKFRWLEKTRLDAEPKHLDALKAFAERAFRRPLPAAEREGLVAFYRSLRENEGLGHEEAVRDTLVSVLMSPHFCYRLDLPRAVEVGTAGGTVQPLDDYALANRLSYFLWSSMPDRELTELAAAGQLRKPEVLVAQANRMLRDPRVRGLAVEFAGNWLDFRRFEQHNGVDRARFPTFTNELRQAMFEEPIRFFIDIAQRDYTFANAVLAKHYGMPQPENTAPNEWVRVDGASRFGRGGLLPMAVFLTSNSPGLRTSPVKRGNWVVKRVLGERIPPPPEKVPELPGDESKLGNLTLRETLARHRADPSCAACHERFDSFGLVFEGYGPVGEVRDKDLGGRNVDTTALFPGGNEGAGLAGLRDYVRQRRQGDFVDNLCRKLLAYGLGRTLQPSDDETVAAMRSRLAANEYRFNTLVEVIVTSPQFRNKRIGAAVAKE